MSGPHFFVIYFFKPKTLVNVMVVDTLTPFIGMSPATGVDGKV